MPSRTLREKASLSLASSPWQDACPPMSTPARDVCSKTWFWNSEWLERRARLLSRGIFPPRARLLGRIGRGPLEETLHPRMRTDRPSSSPPQQARPDHVCAPGRPALAYGWTKSIGIDSSPVIAVEPRTSLGRRPRAPIRLSLSGLDRGATQMIGFAGRPRLWCAGMVN